MDFDVTEFNSKPAIATLYNHLPFYNDLLACTACQCRNESLRVVPGSGPLNAEMMFLGRNPGRNEDQEGRPFIGKGGDELDNWLEILELDRLKLLITNAVKCHTRGDRPPKPKEYMICMDLWLQKELVSFPHLKVIFALGNDVVRLILGSDAASTGQLIAYFVNVKFGSRLFSVIPLAHPGYLIRTRHLMTRMHEGVLPKVKEYLMKDHPEAYVRAYRKF